MHHQQSRYVSYSANIKIGVVSRKIMQILIAQPPAILVMEQPDALWKTSAQAFDVAVFVDFFTAPFQPTPICLPTFLPAFHWRCPLKALAKPRHRRLVQENVL